MKVRELLEVAKLLPARPKRDPDQGLVDMIKSVCPKNFRALMNKKVKPLYRGDKQSHWQKSSDGIVYLLSEERTVARKSASDYNLVLSYVSQSPAWKDYPNRAFSNSCTPDLSHAQSFSDEPWLIIPADAASPFARCEEDFNFLTTHHGGIMEVASYIYDAQQSAANIADSTIPPELKKILRDPVLQLSGDHSYRMDQIQQLSDTIQELVRYFDNNIDVADEENDLDNLRAQIDSLDETLEGLSVMDWLTNHISPKALHVSLYTTYPQIKMNYSGEVWFRGQYVALRPAGYSKHGVEAMVDSMEMSDLYNRVIGNTTD